MRTIGSDRSFIDYWQDYGTGRKSHFGIRVWVDRCCAITNVGSQTPSMFGEAHLLPIDIAGTGGQHSLNNVIGEHMNRHPDSDLIDVLTGKKSLKDAMG